MPFDHFNTTVLNPFAVFILIIMCTVILFIKRGCMIIPVIIIACFITQIQRIVLIGIDFPFLRIILLFGFLRILFSSQKPSIRFNKIDKIMLYWIILRTITHTILWMTPGAFIYMLGQSFEILGTYFLIRLTIHNFQEVETVIKTLILISIPFAIFMIIEQLTGGRNYFSIFGGVPEYNFIREGKLRAQGAFSHPILAGTFGASLFPLAWGMWNRRKRFLAMIGCVSAFIITFASSSSGPVVTLGVGIFGIFFWSFNRYTSRARNLFFLTLIFLHLVMKAPVWHLIGRIDLVGGSTGYHRYMLIDAAVNHFFSWFAFGIRNTGVWGLGLEDLTNQYIFEGAIGGIIPLILFIIIIIKCFQAVGTARKKTGDKVDFDKLIWALGVVLFAHVISFISISYFGQMIFFYYLLVALIANLNSLESDIFKSTNQIES